MKINKFCALASILCICFSSFGSESTSKHPFESEQDRALLNYLNSNYASQITSIELNKDSIIIEGSTPSSPTGCYLVEFTPYETVLKGEHSQEFLIKNNNSNSFSITIPRSKGNYDRAYSRWAIAQKINNHWKLISPATYPKKIETLSKWPQLKPKIPTSKKGMGGIANDLNLLPDLVQLGVKNITLNIPLTQIMRLKKGNTMTHHHRGQDFYFDRHQIAAFDRTLKFCKENEIVVSAIILIPRFKSKNEMSKIFNHPKALAGHYTMPNLTSPEGFSHYAAAMRFLAERYGPPQAPHGTITHWIIHNEVDAGWVWTNMGEVAPPTYMEAYVKSLRIAYTSTRLYNPHAKVFITLTHHWNESHIPSNPRYYKSLELLNLLKKFCQVEGDFEWGLAFHPYPQSLFESKTWNDKKPTFSFSTPMITFKNIEVLDQWIQLKDNLFRGKPRTILLSEQGFHSRGYSEEAQKVQAAGLAYAWKKIEHMKSIEAFHYHRWIDHEREGGLLLGLWTVKKGSIWRPDKKKFAWGVFKALETENQQAILQFAKKIIGIEDWKEILYKNKIR